MNPAFTAALGGAALLAAVASATQAAPVGKLEAARGTSITRMDPALDAVIAPGTTLTRVASGFAFNEGPMWHKGQMWFSDLKGNKVYSVTPGGKLTLRLDHAGGLDHFDPRFFKGSNAMATDKDGTILLCQHAAHRIVRLDDKMNVTAFLDKFDGKRFNSPNDLVFAPDGALWFTDPPYVFADPTNSKVDPDKSPDKQMLFNGVFRYKDGKIAAVIKDLPRPNGIGFSPDGKTLYISNTEPKAQLYKYDVKPGGTVANRKLILDLSGAKGIGVPDGLKVDSKGNLWATGPGGIRIISPEGKVLGQIVLPEVAANLAFGGSDDKTVYVMASTSVYKLPLAIPGEKPLYQN